MPKGIRQIAASDYRLLYDNQRPLSPACAITIVTPNFNRGVILQRMLSTIKWQTFDLRQVEMVIVDDGGRADEINFIRRMRLPFHLRYFWQPKQGRRAGRARNVGIKEARGDIVLFLDADALASPTLLQDHYIQHRQDPKRVLLGDVFDLAQGKKPIFCRHWGCDSYQANGLKFLKHALKREILLPLAYPLLRIPIGLCFCSLHASAKRQHLLAVNGFDEEFDQRWGDEDLELGYRLQKMGLHLRWAARSFVYHQWHPVAFDETLVDNRLKLFLKHPETLRALKIGGSPNEFRHCRLEAIRALCRREAEQPKRIRSVKSKKAGEVKILYDNRLHQSIPPRLSLVVATYQREALVEGFLNSVKKQTLPFKQFEVIITDDGSQDHSLRRIQQSAWPFRLRYVWQPHRGFRLTSCRNHGIDAAAGKIIVLTDMECLLLPNFLQAHYQRHQQNPHLALVGLSYYLGQHEKLNDQDLNASHPRLIQHSKIRLKLWVENIRRSYLQRLDHQGQFCLGTCVSGINCSFTKQDYLRAGKSDPDFNGAYGDEDLEFATRLYAQGVKVEFLNDTLVFHRWHSPATERTQAKENRLKYFLKHPQLLSHRLINTRINPYYNYSISAIRYLYLATKRLQYLGMVKQTSVSAQAILDQIQSLFYIILPAWLYTLGRAKVAR